MKKVNHRKNESPKKNKEENSRHRNEERIIKKTYNIINVTSKKEIKLGRNKNGGCHNDVKKEAKFKEQA